jgi:hypothetical protein
MENKSNPISKTVSIILNLLSVGLSLFVLFLSISSFTDGKTFAGVLFLLASIVFSPITKLLFKNQDKPKQRVIRIVGGVLFVLIALPFVLSDSKGKSKTTEPQPKEEQLTKLKDSLNAILKPKNLDVCMIIHDLEQLEKECLEKADQKHPDFGTKHTNYNSKCIEESYLTYSKNKGLSKDFISKVTVFAMECTEADRKTNIKKLEKEKEAKEEQKEKIQECLQTASIELKYKIKESLHNPKSFEEVSSEYNENNDEVFEIKYTYRGENGFGAVRTETVFAKVSIKDCRIIEITK